MANLGVKISTEAGVLEPGRSYKLILAHGNAQRPVEGEIVAMQPYADEIRHKLETAVAVGAPLTEQQIEETVANSEVRYQIETEHQVIGFNPGDVLGIK